MVGDLFSKIATRDPQSGGSYRKKNAPRGIKPGREGAKKGGKNLSCRVLALGGSAETVQGAYWQQQQQSVDLGGKGIQALQYGREEGRGR